MGTGERCCSSCWCARAPAARGLQFGVVRAADVSSLLVRVIRHGGSAAGGRGVKDTESSLGASLADAASAILSFGVLQFILAAFVRC